MIGRRGSGRHLATVLFTDVVSSTERAIELGDRAWRVVLRRHHRAVRSQLRRFGGHEVDSAGDGFFATFGQPADAVRCALAIRAAVRPLGLTVRCAVHTGEVEPIGRKVGGVAVHLAARVLAAAGADEILVTSTVRELVAGSELTFAEVGTKRFKGFSESWRVFSVVGPEPMDGAGSRIDEARNEDRGPTRRTAIVLGGAIGGVLVVGVLLLLGLAGDRPVVEAGPNTVVRLDPADRLGDTVAVARGPVAVTAADGGLWVASEVGTVTRVDLEDRSTQVVGGIETSTALSAAGRWLWVAQGYSGRVARIGTGSLEVQDEIELHARRLVASDDALWVTDDIGDRVLRVSTQTLTVDASAALDPDSGPRAIAIEDGSIWVANERAATLVQLDASDLRAIGPAIALGSAATDLAIGGGSAWITSMDTDRLFRVDLALSRVTATIEVCDGPDAVVASEDDVWVACRVARVVRRLRTDASFVGDIPVPGVPAALALIEDDVWVALRTD